MTRTEIDLPDEAATAKLGCLLAALVGAQDVIALWGDLGAGKTSLARALIQAKLGERGRHEDIPSPTFTLVQTYETDGLTIWHADLYRLSDPDELIELGLEEARENGLLILEWPDRMGRDLPPARLDIHLEDKGEGRNALLTGQASVWEKRLAELGKVWAGGVVD